MGQGNCAIRLIQLLSSRRLLWPDEACVSPAKWTSTCPPAAVIDDRSAHGEWMSALCPKLGSQPASTDDRTRCKADIFRETVNTLDDVKEVRLPLTQSRQAIWK